MNAATPPTPTHGRTLHAGPWQWRIFDAAGWGLTLILLWLQHRRLGPSLLRSYGTDLLFPAFLYLQMRGNRTLWRKFRPAPPGPMAAALIIFTAGLAWELSQRAHWTMGTYDPLDLLAYAVSLLVGMGLDRAWRSRSHRPSLAGS